MKYTEAHTNYSAAHGYSEPPWPPEVLVARGNAEPRRVLLRAPAGTAPGDSVVRLRSPAREFDRRSEYGM
jgi:hypothetical protein